MGTHVKIHIFETYPVTSANFNRKTIPNIVLSMTASTNIIYFYSKIRTVGGRIIQAKTQFHDYWIVYFF